MREIRVLSHEEQDDIGSAATMQQSDYNIHTQQVPLIISPLDSWEQQACCALHRSDVIQHIQGYSSLTCPSWLPHHAVTLHVG